MAKTPKNIRPASGKTTVKKKKSSASRKTARPTGVYSASPAKDVSDGGIDDDELSSRDRFMSLGDHLEELRRRIIAVIVVVVLFSIVAGFFIYPIHEILMEPYLKAISGKYPEGLDLLLRNVAGALIVMFKLSVMIGSSLSLPICILIIWGFISPAVSRMATFIGHLVVASSSFLFWGGMFVCWRFIFPVALQFTLVSLLPAHVKPVLTLEDYYSFLFMLHIGAGLGFQLPLILVLLGAVGILPISWHKRNWKFITVAIFIFGAVATPPDPITQLIMAGSLLTLYIASIIIVWVIERARRKRDVVDGYAV